MCLGGGLMDERWATAWLMLMQDQEWDEQRGFILFQRIMSWRGVGRIAAWLQERERYGWRNAQQPATVAHWITSSRVLLRRRCFPGLPRAGNFSMSERQIMGHHYLHLGFDLCSAKLHSHPCQGCGPAEGDCSQHLQCSCSAFKDCGGAQLWRSDVEDQEDPEIAVCRLSVHMISSDLKFAWFIVAKWCKSSWMFSKDASPLF